MKIKKEHLMLMAIFLGGLILRILFLRNEVFIGNNPVFLTRLGKNLVESGSYVFGENFNMGIYFPPVYPLFVGLINLFIDDLFLSGKLISLTSSVITILLFYVTGKEILGKEAGLFAAFAFAVYPLALKMSVIGQADALFFCFALLSIYLFIVSVRKNNLFIHILAAISIAMSYLTKPEGLLLLLLPFLYLKGINPFKNKRHLFKIGLMFLTFILVISPYLLLMKSITGKFALSSKSSVATVYAEMDKNYHELMDIDGNPEYDKPLYSLNEEKTQVRLLDNNIQVSFISYVFKHPLTYLKKYGKNIMEEQKILLKLLAPLMLPLFFSLFNKELFRKRSNLIFILFPLLFFMINPLVLIMERHLLLIALFLILFSSTGFMNSKSAFSVLLDFYEIRKNKVISFTMKNIKYIIIAVFILGTLPYLMFSRTVKTPVPIEHINAGYFLKYNISSEYEKLNVMSRQPWVNFYSDSRFTWLPYADSADLINFAKLYKVDYIVIDERLLSKWEFYNELIQLDKYSDDVSLVYEDYSVKPLKLFKINYNKG